MQRLMDVDEAEEVCRDRCKWRLVVSGYPSGKGRDFCYAMK